MLLIDILAHRQPTTQSWFVCAVRAVLVSLADINPLIIELLEAVLEATTLRAADAPKMTPGRASLVGLMDRYLAALLDPFITLLEVHKLMYFLQEAGEPLRLRFVKGPYGPYAENLRHVLVAIEGHLIAGYAAAATCRISNWLCSQALCKRQRLSSSPTPTPMRASTG